MKQHLLTFLAAYFLTCSIGLWAFAPTDRNTDVPSVKFTQAAIMQGGSPVFSNEKITISGIFPNPATSYAALEYEITGDLREAKITISNVLGNSISEHRLTREARKLQFDISDYAPGIYFYTLSIDGTSLFTRKLVVRHSS